MRVYYRPIVQTELTRSKHALTLAGGGLWFDQVEVLERSGHCEIIHARELPAEVSERLTQPRNDFAGLSMQAPKLMGILNVTPDSFSDGGAFNAMDQAVGRISEMVRNGADIIDIGGESTRPGAVTIAAEEEAARVVPIIEAVRGEGLAVPISVDTRKTSVAQAACAAGASIVNDVSALQFDAELGPWLAKTKRPVCLMHAQGDPQTMQNAPQYDNVLLDVFDALAERIDAAMQQGIAMANIAIDPGIGFGKNQTHNLELIRGLSLFHTLGCPILLGVSRKRFIGTLSGEQDAAKRGPGSVAVGLEGLRQGVQMLRVHDIAMHQQAIALWKALRDLKA